MNGADVQSLLIQGGIAGVFVVFAIMMFREFLKYLAKRDKITEALADNVSQLAVNIAHLTEVVSGLEQCVNDKIPDAKRGGSRSKTRPRTATTD